MAKEDWLQNEIQKLAKVLAKLLRLKLAGEDEKIVWEANEALKDLPGFIDDKLTAEEIAQLLIENLQGVGQAKIFSEILKEKALAQERQEAMPEALKSFEIALHLAVWVDENERIFSFESADNIAFLREKLATRTSDL